MKAPLRGNHAVVTERFFIRATAVEGWPQNAEAPRRPGPATGSRAAAARAAGGRGDGAGLRDLTSRAARGQPAAIESLLEHIRPMIVRYCRARLGQVAGHYHVADDVAQEVCIAVLSALPRYRDMGRPFASFVFGIASHKVADAVRAAARLAVPTAELPDGPDEHPGPEETVVAWLEAQRARALLARLPAHLRELAQPGERPVLGNAYRPRTGRSPGCASSRWKNLSRNPGWTGTTATLTPLP